jgi:anti-sigma B factor antagonist
MRIGERRIGEVTVLEISGKLTVNDSPGRVKDKVTSLVFQGHKHIVLNMADVTYVDSSGLGELVACHLTAARGGSAIKLANAGGRMQDLLVLTKLLTLFESHPDEASAIDSFAAATV